MGHPTAAVRLLATATATAVGGLLAVVLLAAVVLRLLAWGEVRRRIWHVFPPGNRDTHSDQGGHELRQQGPCSASLALGNPARHS